jgi:hypothetical protein
MSRVSSGVRYREGIVPKAQKALQRHRPRPGGLAWTTRFSALERSAACGIRNAYCFMFTYEGSEFQTDKRVQQNIKTIASAVCRGILTQSQGSGE